MTRSGERLGIPRLVELSLVCVLIGSTGLYGARVVSRAVTQWADLRAAAAQPDDRVRTIPTGSGLRAAVADGAPFGTLEIPRLHLLASIREGVADHTLDLAVGRIPGTSPTPARGNLGLAAHRDTLFRPLRAVRVGDVVHVSTEGKTFTYLVKQVLIVSPPRGVGARSDAASERDARDVPSVHVPRERAQAFHRAG